MPVLNNTILGAEVTKVDYSNEDGTVKLTTLDGKEHVADHVIMTPSLGVLKAEHETLFNPQLPESKVRNIKVRSFPFDRLALTPLTEFSLKTPDQNSSSGFRFRERLQSILGVQRHLVQRERLEERGFQPLVERSREEGTREQCAYA